MAFQVHGHERVSVLNGGFEKWTELGFPTTSEEPTFKVITSHVSFLLDGGAHTFI